MCPCRCHHITKREPFTHYKQQKDIFGTRTIIVIRLLTGQTASGLSKCNAVASITLYIHSQIFQLSTTFRMFYSKETKREREREREKNNGTFHHRVLSCAYRRMKNLFGLCERKSTKCTSMDRAI